MSPECNIKIKQYGELFYDLCVSFYSFLFWFAAEFKPADEVEGVWEVIDL